jgi:protein-tyrosine phosphatase
MLNIFKKNNSPIRLDQVGVDMHSHLIPGIDDGVGSLEESVESAKLLYNIGYKHVITTPHIMADYYPNTPEIIKNGLDKVQKALKEANIPITIDAAAEYYLDYTFYENFKKENLLPINDKFLLFELSFLNRPQILNEMIFKIQTAGFVPILAHPERYSYWFRDFQKFRDLKDRGVWLQANINSFANEYGVPTRKLAEKLAREGLIDLLGSDFHRIQHIQSMQKALTNNHLKNLISSGQLKNYMLAPE